MNGSFYEDTKKNGNCLIDISVFNNNSNETPKEFLHVDSINMILEDNVGTISSSSGTVTDLSYEQFLNTSLKGEFVHPQKKKALDYQSFSEFSKNLAFECETKKSTSGKMNSEFLLNYLIDSTQINMFTKKVILDGQMNSIYGFLIKMNISGLINFDKKNNESNLESKDDLDGDILDLRLI